MKRACEAFERLHGRVCALVGDRFSTDLALGPDAHFPEPRNMAYTLQRDDGSLCIVVSRKLCNGPDHRLEGVLRHEFGHAVFMWCGKPHGERDADTLAEQMFGDPIYYDKATVQTLRPGVRPRPKHLGA